ncbi:opticin isoform X2 [Sceloporus undulatus]|uniref:opticin isoform X2 n=1 Tax=Sceloporus undulatus TaxID=8520 RepID=UPI001C4AA50C|nr:opticin isoform X2 [Sceloporus undulatus]
MQTAALVGVIITTLTLSLALPTLPKEDGKTEKVKHKIMDTAVYDNLDLDNYDLSLDNYGEIIDLSNYEEIYDYGDLASKIEVGTLAPPIKSMTEPLSTTAVLTQTPLRSSPASTEERPKGPGLFGSITDQGLPTCLICVCISTSVYCDDTDLEHIPSLPLETTYFYARFNRISRIEVTDFSGLEKVKRIDLTSNFISSVDEDSFQLLPSLQELVLPENRLTSLPLLPKSLVQLDARFNMIQSASIRPEAFKNNNIQILHGDTFCDSRDYSHIRRALEDIRLDGNPINLSLFPNAYFCLPRLPTGRFY